MPVAGLAPGRPAGRTGRAQALLQCFIFVPGLLQRLEQAPLLHRPSRLLPLPFPFLPAVGKQRGFPGSGKGAQDEPSQVEGTTSGELLREGDSLDSDQKEQVFLTVL